MVSGTVQTSTGAISKYIPEVLCEEDILIAEQLELQHEEDLALFYKSELEQELQVLPNYVSICESDDDEEAVNEWCNLSYDVYLSQSQKVSFIICLCFASTDNLITTLSLLINLYLLTLISILI